MVENAAKSAKAVLQGSYISIVLKWVFKASANDMIGKLMFF